jgi:hypothetical protein
VLDVLLDVGIIRDAHGHADQIDRIVQDLQRVFPDADPSLVEHVSYADMLPSVLYTSEQPAIARLHRAFATHRIGVRNWFRGRMPQREDRHRPGAAAEGGLSAANALLEEMGVSARSGAALCLPDRRTAPRLGWTRARPLEAPRPRMAPPGRLELLEAEDRGPSPGGVSRGYAALRV